MASPNPPNFGHSQAPSSPPGSGTAQKARETFEQAKDTARDKLGEQQRAAAGGLGQLAGAVHKAADQLDGEGNTTVASFAHSAADGLERLAGSLRKKDLDGVLNDVQDFARRQPVAFFGAAMVAGFLAVRFMKAGGQDRPRAGAPFPFDTRV